MKTTMKTIAISELAREGDASVPRRQGRTYSAKLVEFANQIAREISEAPSRKRFVADKRISGWWVEVENVGGHAVATFGHFATPMIVIDLHGPRDSVNLDLGHGSVSDQRGMNGFFTELGLPFRYSRTGGAGVFLLEPHGNGCSGYNFVEVL
jgi:hypothetical protein